MKKIISWLVRYVPRKYLQRIGTFGVRVIGVFYKGDAVMCPICTHRYKKFLPYGRVNPRPNALCPNCLSLERHRLIWLYLKERTDFFSPPKKILHIAPEKCFIHRLEKIHGDDYFTADIESPLAKVKMDIHQIPFADHTFDVVLCNHVLEHVDDDLKAMREIHRVLKPGGFSILQVPFFRPVPQETYQDFSITDPKERERVFGQRDHVRKYGMDYTRRIASSGLQPKEEMFARELGERSAKHYGIVSGEIIYRGDKPN